jgi:hypothetical protein
VGQLLVGISWFGGRRQCVVDESQHSIGVLTISWDDEKARAKPFLSALRERQTELDAITDATILASIAIATKPYAGRRHYHFDAPQSPEDDADLLEAQRALYSPDLLITSRSLKRVAREGAWVLWQSARAKGWGVSTPHLTVYFKAGEAAKLEWEHLTPAKGGGCELLRLSSLSSERGYAAANDDIQAFAQALQLMPGAQYECKTFADC